MEDEAQRSIGEALVKSSGGILLFDEDSPKLNEAVGFRERVRALLMNQMAEHPGSYIIIYAEPRNRVSGINGDAEHMSDLVNVLVFEDYTKEELMIILKRRLEKDSDSPSVYDCFYRFAGCDRGTQSCQFAPDADRSRSDCPQLSATDGKE